MSANFSMYAKDPIMLPKSTLDLAAMTINMLCDQIYEANVKAGWYRDPITRRKVDRNVMEMLMLQVTEIGEGAEGWRKTLHDDHLAHHMMLVVKQADVLIRTFNLMGYIRNNPEKFPKYAGLDLGAAFVDKILYNSFHEDHKLENRAKPGGKSC